MGHRGHSRQDRGCGLLFLVHLLAEDLGLQRARGGRGSSLLERISRDHRGWTIQVTPEFRVLRGDLPLGRGHTESDQFAQLLTRYAGEPRSPPQHQQGLGWEAAVHAGGLIAKPEPQWDKGAGGLVEAG